MMQFISRNGVRYLTFDIFPLDFIHAVFTREGGSSPEPWDSLNVGGTVGDETERVLENRYRSFKALGRDRQSIFDVWQVHSADVVLANVPHPRENERPVYKADSILTDNPGVTLFMRFADCTPILLYDPVMRVAGLTHAGWQGTVRRAAGEAVRSMRAAYNSKPENILAAIGPSIGPDHYQVGTNVIEQVQYSFGRESNNLLIKNNEGYHFDLWAANKLDLTQAGVEQIEVAELCTACQPSDWYSHRAQKGKTGRFGVLAAVAAVR